MLRECEEGVPGKAAGDSSLTQPEAELVSCYKSLNRKGKDMLLSTARAFAGNPDMTAEEKRKRPGNVIFIDFAAAAHAGSKKRTKRE